MRAGSVLRGIGSLCVFGCTFAAAQQAPATTVNEALLSMAAHAGVIFAGHVVAIDRKDVTGFVDIRFQVDEAVRNCPRQGSYTLREWSGLWSGGEARFRVGQRLLMLLYARGPSGISSPVGGMDGAIPIIAGGSAPLARGTGKAPVDQTSGPASLLVDVRWIRAQMLRGTSSAQKRITSSAEIEWSGPVTPYLFHPVKESIPALQQPTYLSVMALIRGVSARPVATPIMSFDGNQ